MARLDDDHAARYLAEHESTGAPTSAPGPLQANPERYTVTVTVEGLLDVAVAGALAEQLAYMLRRNCPPELLINTTVTSDATELAELRDMGFPV